MNGIHDMGGMHGFGPVETETEEPVFHARWEGRVHAIADHLETIGVYNIDEHRHGIELMPAAAYLADGYYARWLFALEALLEARGVLRRAEIEARLAGVVPPTPAPRNWPMPAADLSRPGSWRREAEVAPRFAAGQRVRVRNHQPAGHTRLPHYVRGLTGTIEIVNARAWVLPDARAHGEGEALQPVYNVAFAAADVWGDGAEAGSLVRVDLWQDYLEAVE